MRYLKWNKSYRLHILFEEPLCQDHRHRKIQVRLSIKFHEFRYRSVRRFEPRLHSLLECQSVMQLAVLQNIECIPSSALASSGRNPRGCSGYFCPKIFEQV